MVGFTYYIVGRTLAGVELGFYDFRFHLFVFNYHSTWTYVMGSIYVMDLLTGWTSNDTFGPGHLLR